MGEIKMEKSAPYGWCATCTEPLINEDDAFCPKCDAEAVAEASKESAKADELLKRLKLQLGNPKSGKDSCKICEVRQDDLLAAIRIIERLKTK